MTTVHAGVVDLDIELLFETLSLVDCAGTVSDIEPLLLVLTGRAVVSSHVACSAVIATE